MKLTFKKYNKFYSISTYTVLFLFSLNLLINFFTVHSHVLADGTRITHSHIITNDSSNGSSENHSHSAEEIESYYLASFLQIGNLDTFIVSFILLLLFIRFLTENVRNHQFGFMNFTSLRGPPQI